MEVFVKFEAYDTLIDREQVKNYTPSTTSSPTSKR